MRNDFGTRPYKSRFPYRAGKTAGKKKKKQGFQCKMYALQLLDMN